MEELKDEIRADTQPEELGLTQQQEAAGGILTNTKLLNTLFKLAKMLSESQIVPEIYRGNPPNCYVACELAARMNVSPLMVMQNLFVVKGKPAWSGQACIALINGTRLFAPLDFVFVGEKGQPTYGCYVRTTRKSDGEILTSATIDMAMVKAEGWLDKNGSKWKTMPEQMFMYRAAAFFARVNCPHALMGLQTVEEVQDVAGYIEPEKETVKITV